jgi:aspartate aminotransferase
LNNPNNPTSKSVKDEVIEEIVQFASEKKIKILSDETYSNISFVKTKNISDLNCEHIVVNSFSKTFAMTGWRIGYVVAEKELVQKMIKLNQISITNVPVFVQQAAIRALEIKERIVEEMKKEYLGRVNLACNILSKSKMKFTRPDAPFYLFPKQDNLDSESFAFDLLDKGVAVTPGTAFGKYKEHFRIALTVPKDKIKFGLKTLCEALE